MPTCSLGYIDQHFNGKIPSVVGEIAISFTDVPPKNWPQPSLQQGRRGVCWAAPAGHLHIAWGETAAFSVNFLMGKIWRPEFTHIIPPYHQGVHPNHERLAIRYQDGYCKQIQFLTMRNPRGCINLFLPARILSSLNSPLFCRNGHSMSG